MFDVSPERTPAQVGTMVSAYRVEKALGSGGMGWVYRARHVLDERVAALKILRDDQLAHERGLDRMMREAAILATVDHAGVPEFYECGLLGDGRPWIAMELVEGTPLAVRMHEGALAHAFVIEVVAAIAEVLVAAHDRGIAHRDLKPENILLVPTDARYPLRVIDWGIAQQRSGARFTAHDESIGTPTYMSPEQAHGGPTDGYSDVYGLGVLAYHALAGRPPFRGATPVEILVQHLRKPVPPLAPRCPDAPIELVELVERMLAKHFEERPTAIEVHAALGALRGSTPAYKVYAVDGAAEGTAPIERL